MVFYIDGYGQPIEEYLPKNASYIGMLGNPDEKCITYDDISLAKIEEHKKIDEFLLCLVMNGTWWNCILFNSDGAKEIKAKYKGRVMLWYWITRERLKFCMHNLQYKEFLKEFPEKR